jgi:uncharacterized protein (TIGR03083 family)
LLGEEAAVSEWNAMTYDARDNILRVVRREAQGMFALAERPEAWEAATAATAWQVRDVIGHMVDVTEGYFTSFDAARGGPAAPDALGLTVMASRLDERARSFRGTPQAEMMERVRADFEKFQGMLEALTREEWTGLTVPHSYMGPLPAFFYPAFQLMDYGVHSWDIRQGRGRAHGLAGDAADLLVPFMLILWQATTRAQEGAEAFDVGVRVTSGPNAADHRVTLGPQGFVHEAGSVEGLPVVFEFDPSSLVLTAFGRVNAGTYRGDAALADRFLNTFFRI